MSERLARLSRAVRGRRVEDVVVGGFVDTRARPLEFRPLGRVAAVQLAGANLVFAAIGDSGRMRVGANENVAALLDEDDGDVLSSRETWTV